MCPPQRPADAPPRLGAPALSRGPRCCPGMSPSRRSLPFPGPGRFLLDTRHTSSMSLGSRQRSGGVSASHCPYRPREAHTPCTRPEAVPGAGPCECAYGTGRTPPPPPRERGTRARGPAGGRGDDGSVHPCGHGMGGPDCQDEHLRSEQAAGPAPAARRAARRLAHQRAPPSCRQPGPRRPRALREPERRLPGGRTPLEEPPQPGAGDQMALVTPTSKGVNWIRRAGRWSSERSRRLKSCSRMCDTHAPRPRARR